MQNNVIRWVVILGAVAIVGILATQSYWVLTTWNLNEGEFNKKVNLALYRVAQTLSEVKEAELPGRDVVKQRTTNYWVVNVEVEIDGELLEYLLQRELEALALNIDFEYAVFDCHSDEMVYGGYYSFTPEEERSDFRPGDLPKDKEFTYYFGVKFPGQRSFLFDRMQLISFLSAILLVTVLFFAYALWVILRQRQLSEMQKDFINNMTHEFKTPLSTIKIAAGVFLNDERIRDDARLQRYANIIMDQNERLNSQVEKVLQIARIEKGHLDLKRERINLADVLLPVIDSTRMRLEEQGGQLTADVSLAENLYLSADPLHLTNILYNLLDNAVKYCQRQPNIRIDVTLEDQCILLRITDNGIGIDPAYLRRVFDKFYRIPTGNVHNVKGFGLGLYYVKRVCQTHGWKIALQSQPGQGTTVVLNMGKALHTPIPTQQPQPVPLN